MHHQHLRLGPTSKRIWMSVMGENGIGRQPGLASCHTVVYHCFYTSKRHPSASAMQRKQRSTYNGGLAPFVSSSCRQHCGRHTRWQAASFSTVASVISSLAIGNYTAFQEKESGPCLSLQCSGLWGQTNIDNDSALALKLRGHRICQRDIQPKLELEGVLVQTGLNPKNC